MGGAGPVGGKLASEMDTMYYGNIQRSFNRTMQIKCMIQFCQDAVPIIIIKSCNSPCVFGHTHQIKLQIYQISPPLRRRYAAYSITFSFTSYIERRSLLTWEVLVSLHKVLHLGKRKNDFGE